MDPSDVRASGLLKETIVLHHPKKQQPTDMTLLREAARTLRHSASHWSDYCAAQRETPVRPLLLVQVEDGGKGQISKTDLPQGSTSGNRERASEGSREGGHGRN